MQMVYFLSTLLARVYHDAKTTIGVGSTTLLQGQARRQDHHASQQARVTPPSGGVGKVQGGTHPQIAVVVVQPLSATLAAQQK